MHIPQASPLAQLGADEKEVRAAIDRVLQSGRYILGPEVEGFERAFAAYTGTGHAVGVASGTDAIHLGLRALGIGAGDEVIAPAHTATATVAAIEMAGATPRLADIDPETMALDPARVAERITPRTRAVIAVHLHGHPADLDALGRLCRERSLLLLEDCAQATGARYRGRPVGSFGDVAAFSFYPTKNLAAIGDGGMIVSGRAELAERARLLRMYGWKERNVSELPGWNSRLDEIQAAVLAARLPRLDADNETRRRIAREYTRRLAAAVTTPAERPGAEPVYHLYAIRHPRRDVLMAFLAGRGIGTAVHYSRPIHLQPAYRGRLGEAGDFPVAERACRETLSLPLFPQLGASEVEQVIAAVLAFPG